MFSYGTHTVKHTLKLQLEIEGLLKATIDYLKFLESQQFPSKDPNTPVALFNYAQCRELQRLKSDFYKEMPPIDMPFFVLPLRGSYDDIECGNCRGSHAGKKELGVASVTIPCFPPNFSSKLKSILLSEILYSSTRKTVSNDKTFAMFISEIRELRKTVIDLFIDGVATKLFFI